MTSKDAKPYYNRTRPLPANLKELNPRAYLTYKESTRKAASPLAPRLPTDLSASVPEYSSDLRSVIEMEVSDRRRLMDERDPSTARFCTTQDLPARGTINPGVRTHWALQSQVMKAGRSYAALGPGR